ATATLPDGTTETDTSSVIVPINLDPGTEGFFTTVKTASVTEITAPGDIDYTITVTNTGTAAVSAVSVSDPLIT
ncbi:hypothetical protein R3X25_15205, partial [Lutibacter sp. TH_r2]|uniref:DUF7507 domain-containing protein n=1 Tax=Lutibacter sp. TH_r2 TaxID=3082083 RepID=UPI00295365E5